jgi:SagB-type dehydrogenase family enzyme
MRINRWVVVLPILVTMVIILGGCGEKEATSTMAEEIRITLPEPAYYSDTSLEETLLGRRSIRDYSEKPITLQQLSQLLWAAQGITDPTGKRTAPSAGALYPLEVYVVVGNVEDLAPGVYRYEPEAHTLSKIKDGDQRQSLTEVALSQESVRQGAIDFVITAIYERTTGKYGERGIRYVHIEAGHAAQNICLQAVALKMGAVTIGAFEDEGVINVLGLPANEAPLYIIPAGNLYD